LRTNLEDISIENAKAILIMNPDQHESVIKDMTKSDLFVIKNILSLGPIEFINKPPIVVEIKHIETKEKILTLGKVVKTLHEHDIMPICFDRRLGQIIAQTLIENHIEDVYLSLFSFKGSEVYAISNVTFDECLKEHSHAIPLAKINNQLFVLSPNNGIKNKKSVHTVKPLKLKTSKLTEKANLSIYIIGKNNKLQFILDSFKQYEKIHGSRFNATWIDENEIEQLVNTLNQSNEKATILLLSNEDQTEDSLDANVIHNLIFIEGKLVNKNTHIIVELLNPKNDVIVKGFSINNTIISNKIISLLLSKLALFKERAPFYEELLTIAPNENNQDDQSITIHQANSCLKDDFPIVFESKKQLIESIYQSFDKSYMIIGYLRDEELIIIEGDLHNKETIEIREDDLLVMIKL
jgi:DNA-binding cell septation regulator SpoVG